MLCAILRGAEIICVLLQSQLSAENAVSRWFVSFPESNCAVFCTTDMPACNHWQATRAGHVMCNFAWCRNYLRFAAISALSRKCRFSMVCELPRVKLRGFLHH